MSNFSAGQRVICIDGHFHASVWEYVDEVPLEGEVYTVRFVRNGPDSVTGKLGPALALEEIPGSLPSCRHHQVCWVARRFVPLDNAGTAAAREKKTVKRKKRAALPRPAKTAPALA